MIGGLERGWAQFDASSRFDCTEQLGRITKPVLILHGRADPVASVELAREMRERITGPGSACWATGTFSQLLHATDKPSASRARSSSDGADLFDH